MEYTAHIRMKHNEAHQALFERGGRRQRGNGNIIEGELVQGTLYTCMELSQ
jgi:hypothetical protein